MSVYEVWQRIESWCDQHVPSLWQSFEKPATHKALDRAESAMRLELPDGFRALYSLHNGQQKSAAASLLPGGRMLPLEEVVSTWKMWRAVQEAGDLVEDATF